MGVILFKEIPIFLMLKTLLKLLSKITYLAWYDDVERIPKKIRASRSCLNHTNKTLIKIQKWYFSLFLPLKKCEKKQKNSRKKRKIRERAVLEIFSIFSPIFVFFHTILKVK